MESKKDRQLINFYKDHTQNTRGVTLEEIWHWDDETLEHKHDFIQWLFPSDRPSRIYPETPLATPAVQEIFKRSEKLKKNLLQSFKRMLKFYGFEMRGEKVAQASNFTKRAENWISIKNHNFLRIDRILRSLSLLGCQKEAKDFFKALEDIYLSGKYPQLKISFENYWKKTVSNYC